MKKGSYEKCLNRRVSGPHRFERDGHEYLVYLCSACGHKTREQTVDQQNRKVK